MYLHWIKIKQRVKVRWALKVLCENIEKSLLRVFLSYHFPDADRESRPSHDQCGCSVRNQSKMAQKYIVYLMGEHSHYGITTAENICLKGHLCYNPLKHIKTYIYDNKYEYIVAH